MDLSSIVNTLRLTQAELEELLADAGVGDADERSVRSSHRWAMQQQRAIITLTDKGGNRRNLVVAPRNLSADGVGAFYGGFIHVGTPCFVTMRAVNGRARTMRGRVARCAHKRDHLHEIGVRFDDPVYPRDFFINVGDEPLFNAEAVDVTRLRGSALIVCQSPSERSLIKDYFRDSELSVHQASSGQDALQAVEREDPDLLFADADLPDTEWMDFISTVRDEGFSGPIILMAAEHDQELRMGAIAAGASEVIFKPLSGSLLHRAAAEYLIMVASGPKGLQPLISTLDPEKVSREVILDYVDELQDYAVRLHEGLKDEDRAALARTRAITDRVRVPNARGADVTSSNDPNTGPAHRPRDRYRACSAAPRSPHTPGAGCRRLLG